MAYSGQGSGTQADPYQVTTIPQLLEVVDIYNNTKLEDGNVVQYFVKIMNDIDFNNYPDFWSLPSQWIYLNNTTYLPTANSHHYIQIDGNGHAFYNMYCYNVQKVFNCYTNSSGIQNSLYINNLTMEIVDIVDISQSGTILGNIFSANGTNESTIPSYQSLIRLSNCDLRIKYYRYEGSYGNSYIFKFCSLTNCVINIDIIVNDDGFESNVNSRGLIQFSNSDNSTTYEYLANAYNEWNIKILCANKNALSDSYAIALFSKVIHRFSSFFIEMIALYDYSQKIQFGENSNSSNTVHISNCYFVVKNSRPNKAIFKLAKTNLLGINFYDSDIITSSEIDFTTGVTGQINGYTTAQCKDAEFLEQQGFIIATQQ